MSEFEEIKKIVKSSEKLLKEKRKRLKAECDRLRKSGHSDLAIDNKKGWFNIASKNDKAEAYDQIVSVFKHKKRSS